MCLLFSGKKKIVRTQQSVNFFFVLTYICIRWGYLQERLQKHIRPTKREAAFWQSVPFVVVVSCRHFVVLDVLAIQRRHSLSRENHNIYFKKCALNKLLEQELDIQKTIFEMSISVASGHRMKLQYQKVQYYKITARYCDNKK